MPELRHLPRRWWKRRGRCRSPGIAAVGGNGLCLLALLTAHIACCLTALLLPYCFTAALLTALNEKGLGICHGVGGNGLCLLALHAHTSDALLRAEATRFALFACEPACADSQQVKKKKKRKEKEKKSPGSKKKTTPGSGLSDMFY
jgi:hypothetical protein